MTPPPEAREAAVCANPDCQHADWQHGNKRGACFKCECWWFTEAAQPAPAAPPPAAPPTWFCNKCGKVGEAATRDAAQKQHAIRSPRCDYSPAWNWKSAPIAAAPSGAREETEVERDLRHAQATIREAAYLMSSRLEGLSISASYVAAYRVLFGYLHKDDGSPRGTP